MAKEYIEREAVIRKLRGESVCKYPASFSYGLFAAADVVKKIPAADVAEVVHGEWLPYKSDESYGSTYEKVWYKCSICGKDALGRVSEDEWYSSPILSNYCPNCGAKMDGVRDI